MKRLFVFFLVILLLAVPASAEGYLICDGSGLLTEEEVLKLEKIYSQYQESYGFAPVFVTTDSFDGMGYREYALNHYDLQGYPEDCVYMLVSLEERHWYMMSNGICDERIPIDDIAIISEKVLEHLSKGAYYEAVLVFAETSAQCFEEVVVTTTDVEPQKSDRRTNMIPVVGGLLIGLITVGLMAAPMKSVKMKQAATDYVRPGSMTVTGCRDIYLYSRVRRSAKAKSTNGSHGSSKQSGTGGRI